MESNDAVRGGHEYGRGLARIQDDVSMEALTPEALSELRGPGVRAVEAARIPRAMAGSLSPMLANAVQVIDELDLAVVKFPEGVGWQDLCVRKRDGWNLLSSSGHGKFNDMAGIRRAGLRPAAIASIGLQAVSYVVGQANMTEINRRLEGIESGVAEIQRAMERQRDAGLKTGFDTMRRIAIKRDEYVQKLPLAQVAIEGAIQRGTEAWNYQLAAMGDLESELVGNGKMNAESLGRKVGEFAAMDARASVSLRLVMLSQQMGMNLEGDYSSARIGSDRMVVEGMVDEYDERREGLSRAFQEKIESMPGLLLAFPDKRYEGYGSRDMISDVMDGLRLGPVGIPVEMGGSLLKRMREAALRRASDDRMRLNGELWKTDAVKLSAQDYRSEMDDLEFAFNEANALCIEGDAVHALRLPAGG